MRELGKHERRALKILEYLMRGMEIREQPDLETGAPGARYMMNDDKIICTVVTRMIDGETDEVLLPIPPLSVDDLIQISENLDEEHFLSLTGAGAVAVYRTGSASHGSKVDEPPPQAP